MIRNIVSIAEREVRSSFVSPLAYVLLAGFMLLAGVFFFLLLQEFNNVLVRAAMIRDLTPNLNEFVVLPFYQSLEIILIFLVPIVTMRSIAEERRGGTFELLATSPLSVLDIVLGKFFGISVLVLVMLLLSFLYPLVLIVFADPEALPIVVGFLGVVLLAESFVALGIAVSACTSSQMVAGVISLVVLLVLFIVDAPSESIGGMTAQVLEYISPSNHADVFLKGVLKGVDLVYFLSVILFGLFVAGRVLDGHRWR